MHSSVHQSRPLTNAGRVNEEIGPPDADTLQKQRVPPDKAENDDDQGRANNDQDTNINAIYDGISPVLKVLSTKDELRHEENDLGIYRAQIDTGAWATCTGNKDLLHHYTEFSAANPSPITLMPATDGSDAVPSGVGYLHVPSQNEDEYLAVRCFYHPDLRTTVIDERDFVVAAGLSPRDVEGERLHKQYDAGIWLWNARHKLRKKLDVSVQGVLLEGKCYTHRLLPPFVDEKIEVIKTNDPEFAAACKRATLYNVFIHQEKEYVKLRQQFKELPTMYHSVPFHEYIHKYTPVNAIRKETERLLWHQRLGHPSDYYLYNAHKHIRGVPIFKHIDPILEQCPTCIQAKQTKEAAGQNSTRTATLPYQGLSIDFSFAGQRSKNEAHARDFVGFNGETCWILISDHFSRMLHGETRISKASPLKWLRNFLKAHAPDCEGKYVVLDQGGELYNNPEVRDLFGEFDYEIRPTGADSSNQNGPVERAHLTVANGVRTMLTGADLDVQFWPYAFHHFIRIKNATPSRDQTESPLKIAYDLEEDFSNFRTFGCRVWVRPPGRRRAKFHVNSRKGVFLGYVPKTTTNILWFDPETNRVKLAKHARFDEGMNDLSTDHVPPNVVHLQRTQQGDALPAEDEEISISEFEVGSSPFSYTFARTMRVGCKKQNFGLTIETDDLNNRAYVLDIKDKSSASRIFSSLKATKNKIRGAYIVKINNIPVFTKGEVLSALRKARDFRENEITIEFAPEKKLSARQTRKVVRELRWHAPESVDDEEHVPVLAVEDLRNIATARYPLEDFERQLFVDEIMEDESGAFGPFSPELLPISQVATVVQAIRSSATTDAEQAAGRFTRRKLKKLSTWPEWEAGERKQLDQFHALKMYGSPVCRPPGAIVLRQHWQYQLKRDGTRRARNCCDGSPRAAPVLHRIAHTYSSCVEQPIQRMFFALAAEMGYRVYGGDAKDAYAHSPPPERPTFCEIDDAYAEWYKFRFGVDIDRTMVLPVQHALQGHPESGRLWETHINAILTSTEFRFRSTTHDRSIYRGVCDGTTILLLRQVDDFALAVPSEEMARAIYDRIGRLLQLPSEEKQPFSYLGLIDDFNGVDVSQYADRTVLSCAKYIERVMRSHGWNATGPNEDGETSKPQSPLPAESIAALYSTPGVKEGTPEFETLVKNHGFSYRTLLGELLYAYVTCRPDIGYAVITLSKFSTCPSDFHFVMLRKVAKYLRRTKYWGIHFRRSKRDDGLPACPTDSLSTDPTLPAFPSPEAPFHIACFVDAAHANDLRRRRSTTGFAFMMAGGCISYKSKTQPLTATSSTEAEFYSAVSAAKHARYLRSILAELGFPQTAPTPMYCDNQSAINMINAQIPTERSRHIMIQYFAIQDWKSQGDIIMRHIPGIINPSDDLTKPLGWVLHARHCRRLMGHYG